jgi:hypothetical protein
MDSRDDLPPLDGGNRRPATYSRASGIGRRIVTAPAIIGVSRVITITGIGDHLRLDQPIIFTGMRTVARLTLAALGRGTVAKTSRSGRREHPPTL